MSTDDTFRCVGRVLKPHGVRGEFVLFLESDFPQWLARQKCFYVESQGEMKPWPVSAARFKGDKLVLKVETLDSREDVEAARGTDLFLPEKIARNVANDPDYFFNSDLVGLHMTDISDETAYGKVVGVIEMPGQNLLEVKRADDKTFLFPFVKALVQDVDLDAGVLRVSMPEGLIDCNDT